MTTTHAPIVLASGSPRRRELLTEMGLPHEVIPSTVDESKIVADHPRTFALRAAYAKARDVAGRMTDRWVLAADTVVTHKLRLFGKPLDAAEARYTLRILSGETHQVITGIALARAGSEATFLQAATTRVTFRPLSDAEIDDYIATGEPMDKAGAYGIQGKGGDLITAIEGDYFNVVGLPCGLVADMLTEANLPGPLRLPQTPQRWR